MLKYDPVLDPPEPNASRRLTRFDGLVLTVMAVLVGAILLTIALGDRVGVQIERFGPTADAAVTARITLAFNDAMNWDTVIDHLRYDPPLTGHYRRSSKTLSFAPVPPLTPGTAYTVTLQAGAESSSGRKVLDDLMFSFQPRAPRVAYLAPADAVPQNVWLAEADQPESAQQITFSPSGILNFDVSPDGTKIAFSERNTGGTSDIKLLDLNTGAEQQVTNCVDSGCDTPVWRPDGSMIAYNRTNLNSDFTQLGVSPTRIWLIDLTTTPPSERPLFSDSQILGYSAQWTADGSRIAMFDNNSQGILIYNLEDDTTSVIPSLSGSDIALSPDGTQVIFPRLIFDETESETRSVLQIADLAQGTVADVIDPDAPIDDTQAVWNPDGQHVAVARRYIDAPNSRTRQLFLLDVRTGEGQSLISDERYANGFFTWDPSGQQLVIQRFPELTETGEPNSNGRPEVWTFDLASDRLVQIARNAYLPRWAP